MSKSASEKWLKEYETIERLVQTISQNLNERTKFPKSSSSYAKLSISIRTLIGKLDANVNNLNRNLEEATNQGNLTQLEQNRRLNLINQLKTNVKQFEKTLREESSSQKEVLIGTASNDLMNFNNATETEETLNVDSNQLLMHQDKILNDQDRGLETLSSIVRNQKQIATTIGVEADRQNALLDRMDNKMDQIHDRLITETKHIRFVDRKSTTCGIWMLIILLFVAIIVILAIPKH